MWLWPMASDAGAVPGRGIQVCWSENSGKHRARGRVVMGL